MRPRERNLFDEIERDALNDDVALAATLRKVIALGGNVGSIQLREWASHELQGYRGATDDEFPDYRKPPAVIMLDGRNMVSPASRASRSAGLTCRNRCATTSRST
jgi:hypothetical protein